MVGLLTGLHLLHVLLEEVTHRLQHAQAESRARGWGRGERKERQFMYVYKYISVLKGLVPVLYLFKHSLLIVHQLPQTCGHHLRQILAERENIKETEYYH